MKPTLKPDIKIDDDEMQNDVNALTVDKEQQKSGVRSRRAKKAMKEETVNEAGEIISSSGADEGGAATVDTGDTHAHRIADKKGVGDLAPQQLPGSRAEVVNFALKQIMTGSEQDVLTLWNKLKSQHPDPDGSTKASTTAMKSIVAKEDIAGLFDGTELTEDAKVKAHTLFEVAVAEKVAVEIDRLEEKYEAEFVTEMETIEKTMEDNIDKFLNYVAEEWINANELAVVSSLKSDLAESLMTGLKNLLTGHFVDIPDDKVNLVDGLTAKIDELQESIESLVAKNIELTESVKDHEKNALVVESTIGMTDVQKAKFKKLAEGVEFDDTESFKKKLVIIKETTIKEPKKVLTEDTLVRGEPLEGEKTGPALDPVMKAYLSAAERLSK